MRVGLNVVSASWTARWECELGTERCELDCTLGLRVGLNVVRIVLRSDMQVLLLIILNHHRFAIQLMTD